jgi:hypothetical protein
MASRDTGGLDMEKNDGGAAFPSSEKCGDGTHYHSHVGMSLRDWFAGQALNAIIGIGTNRDDPSKMVKVSYQFADAMLAERSKK